MGFLLFFFNDTATTEIYTLSLHDALPIFKPGNALPLENIPTGTLVHNVELQPGQGGKMARSAGSGVQLVAKDQAYAVLRLPSGELRRVLLTCRATVGQVG